jgi:hypothetical protein
MAGTTSGVAISKNNADVDIILYQGKTVNFEVIWGGASPINVTGFSARLQAREFAKSATAFLDLSSTNGFITVGSSNGKFTIAMSASQSALLTPAVGVYDFEIVDPSGNVYLVISGKFRIEAEITR